MPGSCCANPIATIIKVGNFDAGIVGLEAALRNVYISAVEDEEQVKTDLLRWVKEFGNYIAPPSEHDYKEALFREYQKFAVKTEREAKLQRS
ncbi:MAG: hypothetical protein V1799_17215 [bacterium]